MAEKKKSTSKKVRLQNSKGVVVRVAEDRADALRKQGYTAPTKASASK